MALKAIASRCNCCDLPTEVFGLRDDDRFFGTGDDRFFGTGWGTPERTRTGDDVFEQIVAAIRRQYRIWPDWLSDLSHQSFVASQA